MSQFRIQTHFVATQRDRGGLFALHLCKIISLYSKKTFDRLGTSKDLREGCL